MRDALIIAVLLFLPFPLFSQSDPDSLLTEWLTTSEWEGLSLHPDIALDWLMESDTAAFDRDTLRTSSTHLASLTVPAGANPFVWEPDSGEIISPVSMKYRFRIRDARRWEFRIQASQASGDSCFRLPADGLPPGLSTGFLIRPGRWLREVIIGDYQVNTGFGAVTGSSPLFSLALGNPASLARTGKGIRLHSGTTQSRFLRGVAVSMPAGRSEVLLFGSGRGAVGEEVAGIGWKHTFTNAEAGVSAIRVTRQEPPAVKEGWTSAWQPGSGRFTRLGPWGQVRVPFGILFGEAGWSPYGGLGWVAGVRWFEAHGFSAVLKAQGCSPGYPVTYSLFQSGTSVTREGQKVTASFRFAPGRGMEWLGSAEVSSQLWPGAGSRFANASTRITHQLRYTAKSRLTATGSVQLDFMETSGSLPEKVTWKIGIDTDAKQTGAFRLRAGIRQQYQGFGARITVGSTADCSLSLVLAEKRLRITAGFRIFSVEAGTDPLYAYEPDILGGFSAPVLTGSGSRWFATVRWSLSEKVDLEIKMGQTAYTDVKHFQEGAAGGPGCKLQVYVRL